MLTLLAGCNDAGPSAPAGASPSLPQPASYVVSGVLAERVDGILRPLADRAVQLFIVQPNRGWAASALTDQNGRYTTRVPAARVFVMASHPPDEQQPCLASAVVDKDTTLDVEVSPVGKSAPPASGGSPLVTGFVYETTPQGRSPLRGVYVSVDALVDVWAAHTRTDDTGRFFLCRVNAPVQMVVSSGNGHQDVWQSLPGTGDMHLDIELKRK
jgi:hypothetical protein